MKEEQQRRKFIHTPPKLLPDFERCQIVSMSINLVTIAWPARRRVRIHAYWGAITE